MNSDYYTDRFGNQRLFPNYILDIIDQDQRNKAIDKFLSVILKPDPAQASMFERHAQQRMIIKRDYAS